VIWVIGSNGMLGTDVALHINGVYTDRTVSVLEIDALRVFAYDKDISWIINCSAYTAVDKAEENEPDCFLVNEEGVANIATVAKEIGAKLIHISTDYVFDGTSDEPLDETAPTNPLGVYGLSKLAGEDRIREILDEHFIIRTSWLYGEHGDNFVHTMIKLMGERDELSVIGDQIGSPTSTTSLIRLLYSIILNNSDEYGLYHFSNEGEISWFEFAEAIMDIAVAFGLIDRKIKLKKITTDEYPTIAKRPSYSMMNKDKVRNTFNINIPTWKQQLTVFLINKEG